MKARKCVVVCEEDGIQALHLKQILPRHGYDVLAVVRQPEEVPAACAGQDVDLLIISPDSRNKDCQAILPCGRETLCLVTEMRTACDSCPARVLMKPFGPEALAELIGARTKQKPPEGLG